ncbi:MAG: hypothetical protein WAK16_14630, partial [Candidatus Cybelea sp.]
MMLTKVTALAAAAGLAGCAMGGAIPYMQNGETLQALSGTGAGKIKHIVYIVQENRSFDNLFHGYRHANTVSSGKNSDGQTIVLQPATLGTYYDIDHSAAAMFAG